MSAILRIGADPADVRRAFSALGDEALRVNRRLQGIQREGARNYDRTLAEEKRAAVRSANEKLRTEEQAAKRKQKLEEDTQKKIQRINQNLALFQQRQAKERTAEEEREAKKRTKNEEREARDAIKIAEAKARQTERTEQRSAERQARNEYAHHQRVDRQIQRDYRQRMRDVRQQQTEEGRGFQRSAGRGVSFAQHVIGAAGAATSEYLSSAAGARATYGDREHTINAALSQANITGTSATAAHQRISSFLVSGQGQGINGEELASALLATQTQTNILSKRGGLETFLSNAQLAASTYQDVGEVTRVGGILGNLGVTGADQRAALMSLIGISRAGSVELKDVSQTALQGVQMAIGQELSRNPNVTGAARSQLISQTAAQALAVTEVGAAQGLTPRDSLNAYNKLTRGMTNENTVEHLRGALRRRNNDQNFQRIDAEMFEEYQDARGTRRHRLRNTDTLQFGQRLTELFGGDTSALLNAMGPGGPGAPMTLDAQTRRLFGALTGRDEEGKTGWQRIGKLKGETLTENDVQASADTLAGEMKTRDTATEERRIQNLVRNQPAQNAVADINAYRAEHPWMSAFIRDVMPNNLGGMAEMATAKLMGFAGAVPGGQNTQRGAGGGAPTQSVPVTLDERSLRGLADTLRNSPLRATITPTDAAINSGQQANLATPPEARTH